MVHDIISQIEAIPEWVNYIISIVSPFLFIHLALKILLSAETIGKRRKNVYFYQDREALLDPEVIGDGEDESCDSNLFYEQSAND
ncbi:MAG: hypothetical protein AB8B53_10455 [Flavobacteriales bacterium]